MNHPEIWIYRSADFDGRIYVKIMPASSSSQYEITLLKDNYPLQCSTGKAAVFNNNDIGCYHASVKVTDENGMTFELKSKEIRITEPACKKNILQYRIAPETEESPGAYDEIDKYLLYIKLSKGKSLLSLAKEPVAKLPLYHRMARSYSSEKIAINSVLNDILPDTYYLSLNTTFNELVLLSKELEKLDYVLMCSVIPDTSEMTPPVLPPFEASVCSEYKIITDEPTPDFVPLQTYLQPTSGNIKGMNVLSAWHKNETGRAATVRHLDFGVYRNHEDLEGNITVVNSRPETQDCNHGTASTGCIAARADTSGVTGIAHDCDFYFYDTGDLPKIVSDAMPGDIVSLDIQLRRDGKLLPVLDNRAWWDMINALTKSGVVVIMAAGNGGLDIGNASGNMNQYGDSGATVVGACYHSSGRKIYFSNFNHSTSLINSWGDWSVVTTGYGSLQRKEGNNRNYSNNYSGTSSATPLCAGACALIQSYAISNFGICLDSYEMRKLIYETGSSEGEQDKIGKRPDVAAALAYLDKKYA